VGGRYVPNETSVTMNNAQLMAPSAAPALVALMAPFQLEGKKGSSPKSPTMFQPAASSARSAKVVSQKMLVVISRPR
jgi:hypothetical protein